MKKLKNFLGQRPLALGCLLIYFLFLLYSYGYWPRGGLVGFYEEVDRIYADAVEIQGSGRLISKTEKNERYHYALKSGHLTLLLVSKNEYPIGADVKFAGKVKSFSSARNDGEFDEEKYYRGQGYDVRVEAFATNVIAESKFPLLEILYQLKMRLKAVYEYGLYGEEAGIMSAIAIGDKAELSNDVKDFFKVAGLSHILAISGLHVSLVGSSIYRRLRNRGVSFLLAGGVSGTLVVLYGLLSGWSISARRSVLMYLIYLLSQIHGKCYDSFTSLAVVAVLTIFTTRGVVTSASFIFSYAAILGVSYTGKIQKRIFIKKRKHEELTLKKRLLKQLVFSTVLCIFLMPVTANFYFEIPVFNILTSLVLLPLITPLLLIGLLAGFIGIFFMESSKVLLYPCHLILFLLEFVSDMIARLRSTVIVGKPSPFLIVLFYILLVIPMTKRLHLPRRLIPVPLLLAVLLIVLPHPHKLRMDFLDVGQGDGIYLETKTYRAFFDGGSTSSSKLGRNTLLPFFKYHGVRSIDYWFVSHGDADHLNGLMQVLSENYTVKNLLISKYCVMSEEMTELISLARDKGVSVIYLDAGDSVRSKDSSISVLWPVNLCDDINENSLVLQVSTTDFSTLITGDIGKETEAKMVELGLVPKVDVLNVAHHGSRYSSDIAFLQRAAPTFAVISCSKTNRYGHPAPETIERLTSNDTTIFYTMTDGQITVRKGKDEEYIFTKLKRIRRAD